MNPNSDTNSDINSDYKIWHLYGVPHREDGPAIEYSSGFTAWCQWGELHREDGPALKYSSGQCEWFLYGERHREDEPAIENDPILDQCDFKHRHKHGLQYHVEANGNMIEDPDDEMITPPLVSW